MQGTGFSRRDFVASGVGGAVSLSLVGRNRATRVTATQEAGESWPQLGHDAQNTGHAPNNTAPSAGIVESWHFPTVGQVSSSATVANGRAVFGTAFGVVALDIADGTREWYFETGRECYRPVVDDGAVYVVDDSNTLYRLHSATGGQQWRFQLRDGRGASTRVPAVDGETVYVADRYQSTVYAIETNTGTERWQATVERGVGSNLTVDGETVLFGQWDGTVQALNTADGSERWRFQTGDSVRSAPTVDGTTVFVRSEDGYVYALDKESGSQEWRFAVGEADASSSPVVGAETVYVVGDGTLYALDAQAGEQQWTTDAERDWRPAVGDGTVYVHSNDLIALDADTGTEQWQFDMSWSNDTFPVVSSGTVYVANDGGHIYAVAAADGSEQWHHQTSGMGFSGYQAIAVASGTAYLGNYDGNVYAVGLAAGTEQWMFETNADEIVSTPALTGDTVVVASDTVYALDGATGTERWRFDAGGTSTSSPAVADGTVYVGTVDGTVYALDAESGSQLWAFSTEDTSFSTPAVADGSVYVSSDSGRMYAIDRRDGTERWARDTPHEDAASVAVADGSVYVYSDRGISAIDTNTGEQRWNAEYDIRSPPAVANETVYFETTPQQFYALATTDGSVRWQKDAGGPATVVNGTVYTGGGAIEVFDGATGERLWEFDTSTSMYRLVAVDDTLYAASRNGRLFALTETVRAQITQQSAAELGTPVSFSAEQSVTAGTGIDSYEWAFGTDMSFSTSGTSVSHTFDDPGEHTVRLRVTDQAGRTDTARLPIHVASPASQTGESQQSGSSDSRTEGPSDGGVSDPGFAVPDTTLTSALVGGTLLTGAGLGVYRWATNSGDSDLANTVASAAADEDADAPTDTEDSETADDSAESETANDSEEPDTSDESGETDEQATAASVPETPAAQFAHKCPAIRSATTHDQSGPVHVYQGVRAEDGQSVRVLALAPDATGEDVIDVFTNIVNQWAGISHNPHIVEVYETGTEPRPWAAVAPSETRLEDVASELDRAERLRVLEGLFDGLTTASLYNISHGSIRPAVVQLQTENGEWVASVGDWGLEQGVQSVIGEPDVTPYTAPEQLTGESTPTTDVYCAGLLAHWLLTGEEPFTGATDLAAAINTGSITQPSELAALAEEVDSVITTATATDPSDRYDTVSDLRDAIRSVFS